ncbi:MAG: LptF/LptG family permease, partial [Bacteroidaceae bacterium]|nr:LptF/LptG family permease [Bacteroidaceae bacterium]
HQKFWWEKITLSLACLIFFFIGAPLGAIIRKGGLGMPVIISVILFIFYYVIENTGSKMAREGELVMWFGVWVSTMVLAPLGTWLTYKANHDSVVFNMDVYKAFFMKLLGLRSKRHIFKKEVIIEDPDYTQTYDRLGALCQLSESYAIKEKFSCLPNYIRIFTKNEDDTTIQEINNELEGIIEILNNSTDTQILNTLNEYPIISVNAHKSPSKHLWLNLLCGLTIPVGIIFYLRIWMFGHRLNKDLKRIVETNKKVMERIKELI